MFKRIKVREANPEIGMHLAEELGISTLVGNVLAARGISTVEEAASFLDQTTEFEDVFSIKDLAKAADRLTEAVELEEKICIYGDYDGDGICSTALLYLYLRDIGANVKPYIPSRSEGYGLNKTAIRRLADEGIDLLITVDNGIVAIDEVAFATDLGIDVIITDHHQPRDILPEAIAVVNPHRADDASLCTDLCGAGVALKLVAAMEDGEQDLIFENYGEIAAIATVGDVVPLLGENRKIVKRGLAQLPFTDHIGLHELLGALDLLDRPVLAEDVAFRIVPRLNAAGRMGHPEVAFRLLVAEDPDEAAELVAQIESYNTKRKQLGDQIQSDISYELLTHPKMEYDSVLVLGKERWSHGVIGISAARLVEQTGKPCFLFEIDGDEAKGSGRGAGDLSLAELLVECDDLLIRYGGHKGAAGLTVETNQLDALRTRMNQIVAQNSLQMPVLEEIADLSVAIEEITVEEVEALSILEPVGESNPSIRFLLESVTIDQIYPIGNGKHLKMKVHQGKSVAEILSFGTVKSDFPFHTEDVVDILVSASLNVYAGKTSVSLKLCTILPAAFNADLYFSSRFIFEKLMQGNTPSPSDLTQIIPTREELGKIYRFIQKHPKFPDGEEILSLQLDSNYGKTQLSLMILEELGCLVKTKEGNKVFYSVPSNVKKIDLTASRLLQRLHTLCGEGVLL